MAAPHVCQDASCDSVALLQQRLSFKRAKSDTSMMKALRRARRLSQLREPEPGDSSAIIPPVHIAQQANIRALGTASTPGTWKAYYNMAEKDMDVQWGKIFPMIRDSNFTSVLEVAAGACRNTEKLLPLAGHVIVTDIDPTAVEQCKDRFKDRPQDNAKLSYNVIDGVHLPVADESVSLIYQFDSGVHFHREVIHDYLKEFKRVLRPGGTGFFHHSNLAASQYPVVDDLDVTANEAWRSNMSSSLFEEYAKEVGFEMLCHPIVTWGGQKDLDAFARFRKPGNTAHGKSESCDSHIAM